VVAILVIAAIIGLTVWLIKRKPEKNKKWKSTEMY